MLGFPNKMCSFDEEAGTFRFSGYDGVMEIHFVLEAPALEQIAGLARSSGTDYRGAFDERRAQIEAAAIRAYKKHRKNLIFLSIADF